MLIARQEAEGRLVFANYLVDVFCLGVKDTFWNTGTLGDFKDLLEKIDEVQKMVPIAPAALVKIVKGAVDFALLYDLHPHPDFRHTSMLLKGIDPAACTQEFTFGQGGVPFYIQGPHETSGQAVAIVRQIEQDGGRYIVDASRSRSDEFNDMNLDYDDDDDDDLDEDDEDLALPSR